MDYWVITKHYKGILPISEEIVPQLDSEPLRLILLDGMQRAASRWAEQTYPTHHVLSVNVTNKALGWFGAPLAGVGPMFYERDEDKDWLIEPRRAINFQADIQLRIPIDAPDANPRITTDPDTGERVIYFDGPGHED